MIARSLPALRASPQSAPNAVLEAMKASRVTSIRVPDMATKRSHDGRKRMMREIAQSVRARSKIRKAAIIWSVKHLLSVYECFWVRIGHV